MDLSASNLDVVVKDSVFDPLGSSPDTAEKIVRVRIKDNRTLYRVWMYLEGNDLPFVDNVTYTLHPSFAERVFRVPRSSTNPNCSLVIWTWGTFEVNVRIEDKKGRVYEVIHPLTYDEQLQRKDIKFWRDEEAPPSSRPRLKR